MILVRHGLMIVGDPIGGKTKAFKVLSYSLADLAKEGIMDEHNVCLPISYICNDIPVCCLSTIM